MMQWEQNLSPKHSGIRYGRKNGSRLTPIMRMNMTGWMSGRHGISPFPATTGHQQSRFLGKELPCLPSSHQKKQRLPLISPMTAIGSFFVTLSIRSPIQMNCSRMLKKAHGSLQGLPFSVTGLHPAICLLIIQLKCRLMNTGRRMHCLRQRKQCRRRESFLRHLPLHVG